MSKKNKIEAKIKEPYLTLIRDDGNKFDIYEEELSDEISKVEVQVQTRSLANNIAWLSNCMNQLQQDTETINAARAAERFMQFQNCLNMLMNLYSPILQDALMPKATLKPTKTKEK